LDVSSGTSILQFAAYWGTLCMYYANTIDWTMAMGVAQILAEGYSASQLSYSANLKKFGSEKPLTEDERRKLVEAIFHEKSESEEDFYRCFPRDDFIRAWLAQPEAFLANAKEALTILEDPHSYEAWAERDETASPNR
jgi:hypothetical protein